ncbi:hypothetical protein ONV78_31605 [Hahella sp. CR1]|uniref:hypothetical protein n=1 Tax=Hahella sp. CR1 TaxID=2992807 RepID=UPI00244268F6|nr:hypothetical protein [Hahella sp. CR1]MDG9672320.1 hypothetical protein [Hahella sp. CR1]
MSDPDFDYDFEYTESGTISEAAAALSGWKNLGYITYLYNDAMIQVGFMSCDGDGSIRGIEVMIDDYLIPKNENSDIVLSLVGDIQEVHAKLPASRTLMAWQVEECGYDFEQCVSDIDRHEINGVYWLDIISSEFVNEELITVLQSNLKETGRVTLNNDGSLTFTRSSSPFNS